MAQRSIPKSKVARAAAIAVTGVKVGANYARYKGSQLLNGEGDRERLHAANAKDTYDAFSKLKGGPLKVAQMLSIDQNLLPRAYFDQFSQAQYKAPPLSYPLVAQVFRKEFGKSPNEIFDRFTREAVSGASIGQVHRASRGGQDFAVKVQYPGVAESLDSDIRLLKPFAKRMFNLTGREMEPYFAEVRERLLEETDYGLELERSQRLSERSAVLRGVKFPAYHREFSSKRVLVMDWVEGKPLDLFALEAGQLERDAVGQALWDFFHHQIHELREFHADPHPGNFLVDGENTLWVLDFGCVKSIEDSFYRRYFKLLDSAVEEDMDLLESCLRELGLVLEEDGREERDLLLQMYRESVELLARPFRVDRFNFGDPSYLQEIRDFGEKTSTDPRLKKISSARGSPDAIYLNRAYFGLYNLVATLGSNLTARLPDFLAGLRGRESEQPALVPS
ncbi:MAG: ABC1 kinase family protein [Puniceicoccaceae bacterium]